MFRRLILTAWLGVCAASSALAQTDSILTWQQVYEELAILDDNAGSDDTERLEADCELLEQLAEHPLDLNQATREQLEQLPFLSAQQVMDIQEYLYRYGPMRSLGELRMVRSLDYPQLRLLPFFVRVDAVESAGNESAGRRSDGHFDYEGNGVGHAGLRNFDRHMLTGTVHIPFYRRRGDRNGYLGYSYRHELRYEYTGSGDHVRAALIGAQDAGEPFFSGGNRWGYDAYSYFIQFNDLGFVKRAVAGKYRLSAGMGLTMGQSFSLGKQVMLQSQGRTVQTLRGHTSRSESDYFLGAAATLALGRRFTMTPFVSYRPIDATLADDGTATTLITSGYHRTPAEMAKKGNTHQTAAGLSVGYRYEALQLGVHAIYTHQDPPLEPNRQTLYRRHWAHGTDFANLSLSYAYTHRRFSLNGETATDRDGHLATVNALSLRPSARLTLTMLQRFYSYRYTTLHGHSFSEGGRVQNESGVYVGAQWNPLAHLYLQAYADYAHFPWARYLVSQSSDAVDLSLQATWQQRRWSLQARWRSRLRQRDGSGDVAGLVANDTHRARLFASYSIDGGWTLKTQADGVRAFYMKPSHGWMLSQHAQLSRRWLQLSAMAAYFHTDDYASRLYVYERHLPHVFSFPTYYGEGLRLSLTARTDVGRRLRLMAQVGFTSYFDRDVIGSGLQQIDHSSQTDLALQLRYRL